MRLLILIILFIPSFVFGQVPDRLILKCEVIEIYDRDLDYYEEADWINILIFKVDGEHRFVDEITWKKEEQMKRGADFTLEEVLEINVDAMLEGIFEGETLDPENVQAVDFSVDEINLFEAGKDSISSKGTTGSIYNSYFMKFEINRNSGELKRITYDDTLWYRAQCSEQSVRALENSLRRNLEWIEEEVRRRMEDNIF